MSANSAEGAAVSGSLPTLEQIGWSNDPFAPVESECDLVLTDLTGALPSDLTGTLYRNGPARWGKEHAVHAFDGDGMLSRFVFDGTCVRYRNRYVRTPSYLAGGLKSVADHRGLGSQRTGGVLANVLRPPGERANTHAVLHADRLLALADVGLPWELDPDTLETLGTCDLGGQLSRLASFSPHPKIDPRTGELYNFGLSLHMRSGLLPKLGIGLRCYRVRPNGQTDVLTTVPLEHPYINHDFALSDRYLVFVLTPLVVDWRQAARAALGLDTYWSATRFRAELGSRIILVPRDGSKPRTIDCPTIPYVHLNNAFDDRGDVVADLVRYDDYAAFRQAVSDVNQVTDVPVGRLTRVRITSGNRVHIEDISEVLGEFPQHDWRRTSQPYRYSYLSGYTHTAGRPVPAIIKVDNATGANRAHAVEGGLGGEPIFVPRYSTAAEDDGWLVFLVAPSGEQRAALYVIDAQDIETEPITIARLPHYAFPGFHGSFTGRVAR